MGFKKEYKKYIDSLKKMFNTFEGRLVLKSWKDNYLDVSCLRETPELTYYALANKEFVQQILSDINIDMSDLININEDDGEEIWQVD